MYIYIYIYTYNPAACLSQIWSVQDLGTKTEYYYCWVSSTRDGHGDGRGDVHGNSNSNSNGNGSIILLLPTTTNYYNYYNYYHYYQLLPLLPLPPLPPLLLQLLPLPPPPLLLLLLLLLLLIITTIMIIIILTIMIITKTGRDFHFHLRAAWRQSATVHSRPSYLTSALPSITHALRTGRD